MSINPRSSATKLANASRIVGCLKRTIWLPLWNDLISKLPSSVLSAVRTPPTEPPIRVTACRSSAVISNGLGKIPPRINTSASAERLSAPMFRTMSLRSSRGRSTKSAKPICDTIRCFVNNGLPRRRAISGLYLGWAATYGKYGLSWALTACVCVPNLTWL